MDSLLSADFQDRLDQLRQAGRFDQAVELCERMAAYLADPVPAARALTITLNMADRAEAAEVSLGRWLRLAPADPEALLTLGLSHQLRGHFEGAERAYNRAIRIRPGYAAAYANLATVLALIGRCAASLAAAQRALQLNPSLTGVYATMGDAMRQYGWVEEAIPLFSLALAADPQNAYVHSNLLMALNYLPGRNGHESREAHEYWDQVHGAPLGPALAATDIDRSPDRRLRVGIVSGDFFRHAVSSFLLPLVEGIDRRAFTAILYSHARENDDISERYRAAAEWRDVTALDDAQLSETIRADRIDILIDTGGHTSNHRLRCFARKPAPVQVTWLGYPNTTGVAAIDYRLTDTVSDPVGCTDEYYTERLIRLPAGFFCYRPFPDTPDENPPPVLRRGVVTFGSFNNISKINPTVVRLWAKLLHRVPGSRLVLKHFALQDLSCRARIQELFARQSVLPSRLVLQQPTRSFAEHLAAYREVDIALDTFPYNGTTTTMEALWMGVPVITLAGDQHCGRVGSSILTQIAAGEWIAYNEERYLLICECLASDPYLLTEIRSTLRQRVELSPLRDESAFCRSFEQALRSAWLDWGCVQQGCENIP